MITRSQGNKKLKTVEVEKEPSAEEEYLERKITETAQRMREFGIHNCCKCGVELEHNRYAARGSNKGVKYYCIPCDERRW